MPRRHRESILLNVFFYGHVRQYHNIQAEIDANIHEVAPAASSSWVQQATRRKTAREPSTRRAPQKRRSEVRTMSHKVIFLGQGTTPARRGAARRRTGKDPPARLLLPGGLTQEAPRKSLAWFLIPSFERIPSLRPQCGIAGGAGCQRNARFRHPWDNAID